MSKERSHNTAILGGIFLFSLSSFTNAQQESWEMPRTSWGDPLIQGYWTNSTTVPLQRPQALGTQEFYEPEEVAEILRQRLDTEYANTERGTAADVHYQFDDYSILSLNFLPFWRNSQRVVALLECLYHSHVSFLGLYIDWPSRYRHGSCPSF